MAVGKRPGQLQRSKIDETKTHKLKKRSQDLRDFSEVFLETVSEKCEFDRKKEEIDQSRR